MLLSSTELRKVSASIDNLANATREANDNESILRRAELDQAAHLERLKLEQEKTIFEASQSTRDRVDISLREYEKLKDDLVETNESLTAYRTFVINMLNRFSDEDKEEIVELVKKNKFDVISEQNPWDCSHRIGIIFKIKDHVFKRQGKR